MVKPVRPATKASKPAASPILILFNKPYGVLSQFRRDDSNDFATLSDFFEDKSLRVAGRLDAISEGLLLLTNDGQVNKALTHPPKANAGKQQGKTYWVQVEGQATDAQLQALRDGVLLKDGKTLPALVERLTDDTATKLWPAADNIAKRTVTTWLAITIFEGKNRQVRRMTAHVGLPCLRLIRMASSGFALADLAVGAQRRIMLSAADLARLNVYPSKPPSRQSLARSSRQPTRTKPTNAANKGPSKLANKNMGNNTHTGTDRSGRTKTPTQHRGTNYINLAKPQATKD